MPDHDSPDRLTLPAILEALAARFIAGASPLRFGIARSAAELEAVYRMRYEVVIERGWAEPEQFPDGLERDAYDEGAIQIVAWDDRVLAASTRLVLPAPDRPLPTEAAFDLVIEPRGKIADIGRTCVAPAYRDVRGRVVLALLGHAWLEAQSRGFSEIAGIFTGSVCRLYRRQAIPIRVLGPGRLYWREERFPVMVQPLQAIQALAERHGAADPC
jgi:N-acyl-L-homoserine lactone synthetase